MLVGSITVTSGNPCLLAELCLGRRITNTSREGPRPQRGHLKVQDWKMTDWNLTDRQRVFEFERPR